MGYRLGVDLGTTYTAAAVASNGGQPSLLGLGNRAMQIPSVFYVDADGKVLVGEVAERRGRADPTRLVRESKRRIGDSVPLLVAGMPFAPQALAAKLLRWVVDRANQQMRGFPDDVVVTHPANWGPFKLDLMHQVVALADLPAAALITEPMAAAVQYASMGRVAVGDTIAVYDLGGGTFDACVLVKTALGFEMLGRPEGIEHLGGIDFDEALFDHVVASLGGLESVDLEAEDVVVGLSRLRRECVEAKEALSEEPGSFVTVSVPGLHGQVWITRSEFEAMVTPSLLDTLTALRRAMRSAGVETEDLSSLVLVGGSSRMPIVGQLLEQELGLAASVDSHPKHDVALGAVQTAAAAPPTVAVTLPVVPPGAEDESAEATVALPVVPPGPPSHPTDDPRRSPDGHGRRPGGGGGRNTRLLAVGAAILAILLVAGGFAAYAILHDGDRPDDQAENTPTTSPNLPQDPGLPQGPELTQRQMLLTRAANGVTAISVGDTDLETLEGTISEAGLYAYDALLSPDSMTVIYTAAEGTSDEEKEAATFHVVGTDGNEDRRLFDDSFSCLNPGKGAWGPDDDGGTKVAVVCDTGGGEREIRIIDLDGSEPDAVVATGNVAGPSFNRDGSLLAYVEIPVGEKDAGRIMALNVGVDGADAEPLTEGGEFVDTGPAWSPVDDRILFRRGPPGQPDSSGIWTMDSNGEEEEEVELSDSLAAGVNCCAASWSPDGDQIAFVSKVKDAVKDAPTRIWVVEVDGGTPTEQWPGASETMFQPMWSRR